MRLGITSPCLASEKCVVRERFRSYAEVLTGGWSLVGSPTVDNGLVLDGASQHALLPLQDALYTPEITIVIEFNPDFDWDEDAHRYLFDCQDAHRSLVFKTNAGSNYELWLYLGQTDIAHIPAATYSPYWNQGTKNTLVVSGKSGDTNVWLNGGQILTNDATVWTPKKPTTLYVGTKFDATNRFDGIVYGIHVFQEAWDATQEVNWRNGRTFSALKQADVLLDTKSQISAPDIQTVVADGDMEAAGTGAWTLFAGAMSKEVESPHGGTQVLRLTDSGVGALVLQAILINGRTYNVRGYARSGGTKQPALLIGGGGNPPDWVGTTSTAWQPYDVTAVSDGNAFILSGAAALAGYIEFDDVSVHDMTGLQQTRDLSGSGRSFLLGDGVTPATYPAFQNPGFVFDGVTDHYLELTAASDVYDNAQQSVVVRFNPGYGWDEAGERMFFDSPLPGRVSLYRKAGGHELALYLGNTLIAEVAPAVYGSYWRSHDNNVIVVAGESGNTSMWLNGHKILDADPTAWTPGVSADIQLGIDWNKAASNFKGVISHFSTYSLLLSSTQAREINHRLTAGAA